jgi:hypothetical protein
VHDSFHSIVKTPTWIEVAREEFEKIMPIPNVNFSLLACRIAGRNFAQHGPARFGLDRCIVTGQRKSGAAARSRHARFATE